MAPRVGGVEFRGGVVGRGHFPAATGIVAKVAKQEKTVAKQENTGLPGSGKNVPYGGVLDFLAHPRRARFC